MGSGLLVKNARVLDVATGSFGEGTDLLMSEGSILEVGQGLASSAETRVIDATGLVVIPGLIDAHVHVTAAMADLGKFPTMAPSYVTAHSARIMHGMLERGFTTVRDMGGADHGLVRAQREGLVPGPRIPHCGRALSQTGGHGDFRGPGQTVAETDEQCAGISRVVDGAEGVRAAARDELRKGADFLKVMASGGVASPTDRIDSTQSSISELQAVVEEASASNRYVAAHAYTARAVNRALTAGVRSIEHGNLIDETSLQLLIERHAFLVPTLVTYGALKQEGLERGLPHDSWDKVDTVLTAGLDALRRAEEAHVQIAFGTDLLGEMHVHQSKEFQIRAQVQPPLAVVQSATNVAANLIGMSGLVGCLSPGAHADAIILDADPLINIEVLATPDRHLRYVIQGGLVVLDNQRVMTGGA